MSPRQQPPRRDGSSRGAPKGGSKGGPKGGSRGGPKSAAKGPARGGSKAAPTGRGAPRKGGGSTRSAANSEQGRARRPQTRLVPTKSTQSRIGVDRSRGAGRIGGVVKGIADRCRAVCPELPDRRRRYSARR